MTYAVSPRAKKSAQNQRTENSNNLAKNIAGFVTPAAALSLGVLAFVTISDQAEQGTGEEERGDPGPMQSPGEALVRTQIPTAELSNPSEIAPNVEADAGKPDEAQFGRVASSPIEQRGSWQPASLNEPEFQLVARPLQTQSEEKHQLVSEVGTAGYAPDILSPIKIETAFANIASSRPQAPADLKSESKLGGLPQPTRLEIEIASSFEQRQEATSPSGYVRRDYSRTIAIAGRDRDIPLQEAPEEPPELASRPFRPDPQLVGQMREKIGALRNASLRPIVAKNLAPASKTIAPQDTPPTYSGNIAREDITTIGGELATVRLGALIDIVETELGAERHAELAGSPSARVFVDRAKLQASGIDAAYHPGSGTISLSAHG